jgi:hypothetical protein
MIFSLIFQLLCNKKMLFIRLCIYQWFSRHNHRQGHSFFLFQDSDATAHL